MLISEQEWGLRVNAAADDTGSMPAVRGDQEPVGMTAEELQAEQQRGPVVEDLDTILQRLAFALGKVPVSEQIRARALGWTTRMQKNRFDRGAAGRALELLGILESDLAASSEPKILRGDERTYAEQNLEFVTRCGDTDAAAILRDALAVGVEAMAEAATVTQAELIQ